MDNRDKKRYYTDSEKDGGIAIYGIDLSGENYSGTHC